MSGVLSPRRRLYEPEAAGFRALVPPLFGGDLGSWGLTTLSI